MNLLHISDLHFGEPYLPEVGEALLKIAPELGVEVIVVSGDLTQRAKPSEFADAKAFLQQLPPVPQIVVPGNHDIPLYRVVERLSDPHGNYRRLISDELNRTHVFDEAVFVGLDSTAPRQSIVNGRIHPGQLEYCEEAFRNASPDAVRIVVAHHHFAPAPDYEYDQVMPQAKRAINRFVDLEVDVIMGGHLHRAYIGNTLDIYAGIASEASSSFNAARRLPVGGVGGNARRTRSMWSNSTQNSFKSPTTCISAKWAGLLR